MIGDLTNKVKQDCILVAFYDINNPDKPINEDMYKAFIKPLVDTLKIVQNISNGFDFENGTLSYENYFELSQQYEQYVNTRLDSKITKKEGSKVDFIGKEGVHTLYETMVLGYNGLAKLGMTKDFFNIDFGKSTLIHQVSMQKSSSKNE